MSNYSFFSPVTILTTVDSSSYSTGALTVTGGAGIAKNLYVNGNINTAGSITGAISGTNSISISGVINTQNTTVSTTSLTGALIVAGGAGINGSLNVGTNLTATGLITASNGLTSTAGTTTLGTSTIGAITGTSATFSSTLSVTGVASFTTANVSSLLSIASSAGGTNVLNFTRTSNANKFFSFLTIGSLTGTNAGGDLQLSSYDDSNAFLGTVFTITRSSRLLTIGNGGLTSTLATTTLGATTIGAITGTSATFSTTLGVTGLLTASGGITSTSGTTTLGTSTIGAITGTSATFSSTLSVTGAVTTPANLVLSGGGSGSILINFINIANSNRSVFNVGIDNLLTSDNSNGGELSLRTYNDAGSILAVAFKVIRSTSQVVIGLGGLVSTSGNSSFAATTISGVLTVSNTTVSTTTTSGAVQVAGGMGVVGNSFYGGNISATGVLTNGGFDFVLGNSNQSTRGNSGNSRALSKSATNILVVNYAGDFTNGVSIQGPSVAITGTTVSTSTSSGALVVSGGAGIAGAVNIAGTTTLGNTLSLSGFQITNVAAPTLSTDAANKAYVDMNVQGLSTKQSVIASTTTAGTLASSFQNGSVIDGITLATGNRILIKDQATATENGIYTVNATGSPTRAIDFSTGTSVAGSFVFVEQGTVNADAGFTVITDTPNDIVGTNSILFTQFSGAGSITAGTGLSKTANTLSVNTSQTQITQVGTLANLSVTGLSTLNGGYTSTTGTLTSTSDATSSTSGGGLTIAGGLSVAKKVFIGGTLNNRNLATDSAKLDTLYSNNNSVRPEDYGATGDGTTDDTTAVQNCINASSGSVCFNSTYVITSLQIKSNTTYFGRGTLKLKANTATSDSTCVFFGDNATNGTTSGVPASYPTATFTNVSWYDITFDGNRANNTAAYIHAYYKATNIRFEKCKFINTGYFGIRIIGSYGATNSSYYVNPDAYDYCQNVIIKNCQFTDCYKDNGTAITALGRAIQFVGVKNGHITANTFTDCGIAIAIDFCNRECSAIDNYINIVNSSILQTPASECFGMYVGQACQGILCQGNTITNVGKYPIGLESCSELVIKDNNISRTVSGFSTYGIQLVTSNLFAVQLGSSKLSVTTNQISGCETGIIFGSSTQESKEISCVNNIITNYGGAQPAIVFNTTVGITCQGNIINAYTGLFFYNCKYANSSNNQIKNSLTGLYISGTATSGLVFESNNNSETVTSSSYLYLNDIPVDPIVVIPGYTNVTTLFSFANSASLSNITSFTQDIRQNSKYISAETTDSTSPTSSSSITTAGGLSIAKKVHVGSEINIASSAGGTNLLNYTRTSNNNKFFSYLSVGSLTGSNAGGDLQLLSYDDSNASLGTVYTISRNSRLITVGSGGLTSVLGTTTLGATTIGAVTGTSATFSGTQTVTGLITASGGLTSTSGTTTLGASTIGTLTGTSATFSSTVGITGLLTASGGLTSTTGTTTLGISTIGAITGTSATFSSTLGVTGIASFTTANVSTVVAIASAAGGTNVLNFTRTSNSNKFFSFLTVGSLTGSNAGGDLQLLSYDDSNASLGTVYTITRASRLLTIGSGGLTSTAGTTTLGASTIGLITGTSATFSSTLSVTGLLTASGGLTSTASTTTLGASTIGAITGTSATFSSTVGVTGLLTASGGLTSTAGTTTLGASTIGAITGTSATFSSTLGVTGLLTTSGGLTSTAGTTTLGASTIGTITGTNASFSSSITVTGAITTPLRLILSGGGSNSILINLINTGNSNRNVFNIGIDSTLTSDNSNGGELVFRTYDDTGAYTNTPIRIIRNTALVIFSSGITSTTGTNTLGATSIGAITGTSATFSGTQTVTGLLTASGGLTSTAGTTSLGSSTIGAITGTSATFSGTISVTGLLTASGGITSTASTTTLGSTTAKTLYLTGTQGVLNGTTQFLQSPGFGVTVTDSTTVASGTLPTYFGNYFGAVTLNASNTTVTTTTASTVYIEGPVTAGTNETITNNYALNVVSGISRLNGFLTGTSASFSGTLAVTGLTTLSGGLTSTAGTTTLGSSTIGVITGTSATFSGTLSVTGLLTASGGLTSTAGTTTLGASSIGAITGTSATFSTTLGVTGTSSLTTLNVSNIVKISSAAGGTNVLNYTRTSNGNNFFSYLTVGSLTGSNAGGDLQLLSYDDSNASLGTVYTITRASRLLTIGSGGLTSTAGTTTLGSSTIGAITGTSATFSSVLTAQNLLNLNTTNYSGALSSTSGIQSNYSAFTFTDSSTVASGTATNALFNYLSAPTLAATNTAVTTTNAATLYIAGAPIAGTNETITNPYALLVNSGVSRFASTVASTSGVTGAVTVSGGLGASGDIYSANSVNVNSLTTGTKMNIYCLNGAVDNSAVSVLLTPSSSTGAVVSTLRSSWYSDNVDIAIYRGTGATISRMGITVGGSERFSILANGNVGISNSNPQFAIDNAGTMRTSGAVTFASTLSVTGATTISDTTVSTSSVTGSLKLAGSLAISNTTDAVSATNGGTVTTSGGMAIAKSLFVGSTASIAATLTMNSQKITNLANPTVSTDAANKAYVDLSVQGLSTKQSVAAATTTSGTLASSFANGSVIDSVTLATNDRILIKDQTTATENGIYTVNATGAPSRAIDFATGTSVAGSYVFVEKGTVNADSGFVVITDPPSDIVDTNSIAFTQFSGAGSVTAGTGLSKTGNTLSVNASQTQVTTIGTLTSLTVSGVFDESNTTDATGATTGSMIIRGGASIAKNVYIGKGIIHYGGLTTINTDTNYTYLNTDIVPDAKIYRTSLTAARTDTLPSAANIVSAIAGVTVGTSYKFIIINNSGQTLTINSGTGLKFPSITLVNQQTATYTLIITNVTSASETVFGSVAVL